MTDNSIKCPECRTEIEISTVLSQQIEKDLKQENARKLQQALAEAESKSQAQFELEKQALEQRLKEQDDRLIKTRQKELDLQKMQQDLDSQRQLLDQEVANRLQEKEKVLRDQLEQQAKQATALEITDLREQIKEKDNRVELAQKTELDLRKQARIMEEKQKSLDLDFQRKLDQECQLIETKIGQQFADETNLKLDEKQKQIDGLRKSLEDAKRKSEQGSMETQGEVLELDLEQRLRGEFIHDEVSPVPKGIKGADVIQEVRDGAMNDCGKIIWEAKNTKNWSAAWLQKLKDDQREIGANMAILISMALPEGIRGFGLVEGVWVTDRQSALPLAASLREQLIQVNFARNASMGKNDKMEVMFSYLSGDEFRQRVEAIVETFSSMQDQLNKEKRAMERIWREREKQIQRITSNTVGMYGDVRGIIGSSVQAIPALELDDHPENTELGHNLNVDDRNLS